MQMGRCDVKVKYIAKCAILALLAWTSLTTWASASLQCDVSYAGTTYKLNAKPALDVYTVQPIEIGGRFFFKMILTETDRKLDQVLIYVYLDQKPRPILLQQAKYKGPFSPSLDSTPLTGQQHLYGGPVERELIYSCSLSTSTP